MLGPRRRVACPGTALDTLYSFHLIFVPPSASEKFEPVFGIRLRGKMTVRFFVLVSHRVLGEGPRAFLRAAHLRVLFERVTRAIFFFFPPFERCFGASVFS